jgi:hypothetical protein
VATTALQLVNRVRVKGRNQTKTIITDTQGVALLDYVNGAATTILEEMQWGFQRVNDGQLTTKAKLTGTDAAFTEDSTSCVVGDSVDMSIYVGEGVARIQSTESTDAANSAMQIESIVGSSGATLTFKKPWANTTISGSNWSSFMYEYALPATVRNVVKIWYEETPIDLVEEDATSFEEIFPRPWDDINDQPRVVVQGGTIVPSDDGSTAQTEKQVLKVWPVPETQIALNYSYLYKQPKLTVLTDTLWGGVPEEIEDAIVELAYARSMVTLEENVRGFDLERKVMSTVRKKHANQRGTVRVGKIKSLDDVFARNSRRWPGRTVETGNL